MESHKENESATPQTDAEKTEKHTVSPENRPGKHPEHQKPEHQKAAGKAPSHKEGLKKDAKHVKHAQRSKGHARRRSRKPSKGIMIAAVAIFIAIIAIALTWDNFFGKKTLTREREVAAIVNGDKIYVDDIEHQYAIMPPEYVGIITKDVILQQSIEKKLLIQEAAKRNIAVTDQEVEDYVQEFIDGMGVTRETLEKQLEVNRMTFDDVYLMFREQMILLLLVNETVLPYIEVTDDEIEEFYMLNNESFESLEESRDYIEMLLKSGKQPQAIQEYIDGLKKDAEIEILADFETSSPSDEQTSEGQLSGVSDSSGQPVSGESITEKIETFTDNKGAVCTEAGKPVVYLFTTTWCPHCSWISDTYEEVVGEYEGRIAAYHWEIDTGDDGLTPETEAQVPEEHMDVYERFNPGRTIPTFIFGCRHVRIGNGYERENDLEKEAAEFRKVIESLLEAEG